MANHLGTQHMVCIWVEVTYTSSNLPMYPSTYVCALIILHMMKGVVTDKASFWFRINKVFIA